MKKLIMTAGAMVLAASVYAATAPTFGYQGVLRDEKGNLLADGQSAVTITFTLYDGPDDGAAALWGRKMTVAIDTNGLFNAELADASGNSTVASPNKLEDVIRSAEAVSKPLYVGLLVLNSSGEIRPRQKLISVPMAAYAQDVSQAKGDLKVNGTLTADTGLSTPSKLTAAYLDVTEKTVSTFAGPVNLNGVVTIGSADQTQTSLTVNGPAVFKDDTTVPGLILSAKGKVLSEGKYECSIPVGTIVAWAGSPNRVPKGWVICDGSKSKYTDPSGESRDIPDLRGRFILGANSEYADGHHANSSYTTHAPGASGGSEKVTLSPDEMPSHYHQYYGDDQVSIIDTVKNYVDAAGYDADSSDKGGKSKRFRTDSVGGGKAHDNMPPFYALCYIMYVGADL